MANAFWNDTPDLIEGTKATSTPINEKFDGIEQGFDRIDGEFGRHIRLPSTFTGNREIPAMSVANTVIYIDTDGNASLYPMQAIQDAESNAAGSASAAASSASLAEGYRDNAQSSASAAATSESNASDSAASANTSQSLAAQYANEAEDIEVTPGLYSAMHWSLKAEAFAGSSTALDGQPGSYYLNWANFTGTPTTLTGYGITDAATAAQGSNADTAFGWGDHGAAGYAVESELPDAYEGNFTAKDATEMGYTGTSLSGRFAHLRGGLGIASVTFPQAQADAASKGVRLPTLHEMEDELVKGTGGGFDSQICWTCTPVPGRPGYVYAKLGTGAGTRYEYPTDGTQTAYSRYVADLEVPFNITNWDTAYGWGNHASAGYYVNGSGQVTATSTVYCGTSSSSPIGFTVNDGGGNCNIVCNHFSNNVDTAGKNAFRITFNGDGTSGANMSFRVASGGATPTERMSLTDSGMHVTGTCDFGNVRIGADNHRPGLLGIWNDTGSWGGIQIRNGAWEYALMADSSGICGIYNDNNNEWALYCVANGATYLRYNGSNKLYTYSNGGRVTGNFLATGDVYAAYSDERLKDKDGLIEDALAKVQGIDTFFYRHNETAKSLGYEGDERQVGVSAQSVQAVLPEVIKRAPCDDDGEGQSVTGEDYMTVCYDRLVPLLVEAIKEQQAQIEQLKEAINGIAK